MSAMLLDVTKARELSNDYLLLSMQISEKAQSGKYFLWFEGNLSQGQIDSLKNKGFYVRYGRFVSREWFHGERRVYDRHGALIYWGSLNFEFLDRLSTDKFGDFISELNGCSI